MRGRGKDARAADRDSGSGSGSGGGASSECDVVWGTHQKDNACCLQPDSQVNGKMSSYGCVSVGRVIV